MTISDVSAPVRPPRLFLLPPPLFFGLAFGAGMLLQHVVPLTLTEFPGRQSLGFLVLIAGIICGSGLAAIFLVRRTTLNPFATPRAFLERGIYRLSRNPMYLGLVLVYLGGCLLVTCVWPLLFLIIPVAILNQIVIPFEEASMRRAFGASYQAYCARVRRWI